MYEVGLLINARFVLLKNYTVSLELTIVPRFQWGYWFLWTYSVGYDAGKRMVISMRKQAKIDKTWSVKKTLSRNLHTSSNKYTSMGKINESLFHCSVPIMPIKPESEVLLVGLPVALIVTIIPGRVLRMHKQSGVHVHSEYAFAISVRNNYKSLCGAILPRN